MANSNYDVADSTRLSKNERELVRRTRYFLMHRLEVCYVAP